MSVLNSVAKVVLGDRFEEFARRHAQFVSDKSSVIEDDDFADYLDEDSNGDDFLWAFAYRNRRMEWIDWSGEEDPEQLKQFVQERLENLAGLKLDWAFLERFDESIDFNQLERGDYFAKKLTCVDQEIREKGFLLATLDREDDQYYPFVASLKSFAAIDGAEIGMTTITAWANAS